MLSLYTFIKASGLTIYYNNNNYGGVKVSILIQLANNYEWDVLYMYVLYILCWKNPKQIMKITFVQLAYKEQKGIGKRK